MSKVDLKRESEKPAKNKLGRKHRRDAKLQELERQLEFAESRCGTLKQQLDYIKLLYGCKKGSAEEKQPSMEEGRGDGSAVHQFGFDFPNFHCQNENFANKENGDGPENVLGAMSRSNTATTNSSHKLLAQERYEGKKKSPKAKNHLKLLKAKKKICKKVKKRRRPDGGESSKVSNASSQTPSQVWQDPVVEIYKNSALNVESESGFEIFGKSKVSKHSDILSEVLRQKLSEKIDNCKQPEEIREETKTRSCNFLNSKKERNCAKEEESPVDRPFDHVVQSKQNDLNLFLNKENAPKTESVCLEPVKGYCQPTISSKRKRVERDIYSNLNNLNIRNIPFIAARSTTPSHNIGINIQQVLSIIKKRQPLSENFANAADRPLDNPLTALLTSRKTANRANETESAPPTGVSSPEEAKKRGDGPRTSLSYWKSNSEINKEKPASAGGKSDVEHGGWSLKVDKLKKVLVFLHEDFTSLSQKYKRLQKKLTKRNITKTDAKDELADIEHDLEKKEEEIIVVIALYKEVLNLREELKKLQEKYDMVICGRNLMMDGLRQSNSAHTQMTSLLRKIQNFQDKLKG